MDFELLRSNFCMPGTDTCKTVLEHTYKKESHRTQMLLSNNNVTAIKEK